MGQQPLRAGGAAQGSVHGRHIAGGDGQPDRLVRQRQPLRVKAAHQPAHLTGLRPAAQRGCQFRRAHQRHRAGLQQAGGGAFGSAAAADHQDGTATQIGKEREQGSHGPGLRGEGQTVTPGL